MAAAAPATGDYAKGTAVKGMFELLFARHAQNNFAELTAWLMGEI